MTKKNPKPWNFEIFGYPTALGYWPANSLSHFEQLSFLERLNPNSLSKVMTPKVNFVLYS